MRGSVLLEFGPVLCGRRVYLLKNNGALYAISRTTGRVSWKRKLGSLAAAAPACHDGTVYAVLLKRFSESGGGRVIAVTAKSGRTRWSRRLPSRRRVLAPDRPQPPLSRHRGRHRLRAAHA